jgi:hypothetical protein
MLRTMAGRLVCWTALFSLVVIFVTPAQPILRADGPVKKTLAKRGRLPAHYAKVVTDEQREKIYGIQAEYAPKITALETQLKALKAERDEKIKAVLTPQQQKQVEEAKAKARKKEPQPKAVKPSEGAPATPPAEQKPAK